MPPFTLIPVTPAHREPVSRIFCTSYNDNSFFRLQYPSLFIPQLIPDFSLRFPAGKLARPNCWHHLLLDAEVENEPIAYARWELPERVFERLKGELRGKGGRMGLDGVGEEEMEGYRRERERGYVGGEPVGMDPMVAEEMAVELREMKERHPISEEYIELDGLHTLPEHERKGAGTALMKWGIDVADREGLMIRLHSTAKGLGLYRKLGFVELDYVTYDMTRWGGEGEFSWTLMSREPKAVNT